jgi:hypothetical protein
VLTPPIVVAYGEWLWRTHTIQYTALPDLLVVLDLATAGGRGVPLGERNAICSAAGLETPPVLTECTPRTLATLSALCGPSRWGAPRAEGLVLRAEGGEGVRLAKYVCPGFRRVSDQEWRSRGLVRNTLARGV